MSWFASRRSVAAVEALNWAGGRVRVSSPRSPWGLDPRFMAEKNRHKTDPPTFFHTYPSRLGFEPRGCGPHFRTFFSPKIDTPYLFHSEASSHRRRSVVLSRACRDIFIMNIPITCRI